MFRVKFQKTYEQEVKYQKNSKGSPQTNNLFCFRCRPRRRRTAEGSAAGGRRFQGRGEDPYASPSFTPFALPAALEQEASSPARRRGNRTNTIASPPARASSNSKQNKQTSNAAPGPAPPPCRRTQPSPRRGGALPALPLASRRPRPSPVPVALRPTRTTRTQRAHQRPPPRRTRPPQARPRPPPQRTQATEDRPRRRRAGLRAVSAHLFAGNLGGSRRRLNPFHRESAASDDSPRLARAAGDRALLRGVHQPRPRLYRRGGVRFGRR